MAPRRASTSRVGLGVMYVRAGLCWRSFWSHWYGYFYRQRRSGRDEPARAHGVPNSNAMSCRQTALPRRRRLAPMFPRSLISGSLIGDSHTGRRSIGLARDCSARNSLDRSCGNPVRRDRVQSRPLVGLRQWAGGVRRRRCSGGCVGPRVALRRGFVGLRRRSGWRRWRRC